MSDSDSFIDEVTEEVRRDRFFLALKKYGWIGGVAVALIVGGASWREYQRAQDEAAAQAAGDAMRAALAADDTATRAEALATVEVSNASAQAIIDMARAAALDEMGDAAQAASLLDTIAANDALAPIYRDVASFKSVTVQSDLLPVAERRARLEPLAAAGAPLQFLASEQLALLDIEVGARDAALARLQEIAVSAGVTRDLLDRVRQLIVVLGGKLDADVQEG